jgi:hypothetical protein
MKKLVMPVCAVLFAMTNVMAQGSLGVADTVSYDSAGTYTLNMRYPGEVEIYAVGGGGGGQGGNYSTATIPGVPRLIGTGGSGGGGAATYGRLYTATAGVLKITVGAGGVGGGYSSIVLTAGLMGRHGENTNVTLDGDTLIVAQGGIGGGWDRDADENLRGISGGPGGVEAIRPDHDALISYSSSAGDSGTNGSVDRNTNSAGGRAGKITYEEASINPWGGFDGAVRDTSSSIPPGYGGGGSGSYRDAAGTKGGDGHVFIIIRYSYTVTFDSRGGSEISAMNEALYNATIEAPEAPTAEGCVFIGWSTKPVSGQLWDFETDKILKDTTLYAQWMPFPSSLTHSRQLTGAIRLEWGYGNPSEIGGAFYVYRREIAPRERDWMLLNGDGIQVNSQVTANRLTYRDTTVTSNTTYEYLIIFVEGDEKPSSYEPPDGYGASRIIETGESGIHTSDREIPGGGEESGFVIPVIKPSGEFTAGPNPVGRIDGSVAIFRSGPRVQSGKLSVYDAAGNLIAKIGISDKSVGDSGKRQVGSWNLKDRRGRAVSAGSYVVKGTVVGNDGKRENVSLVIGVR